MDYQVQDEDLSSILISKSDEGNIEEVQRILTSGLDFDINAKEKKVHSDMMSIIYRNVLLA